MVYDPQKGNHLSTWAPLQMSRNDPNMIKDLVEAGVQIVAAPLLNLVDRFNCSSGGLETSKTEVAQTAQAQFDSKPTGMA